MRNEEDGFFKFAKELILKELDHLNMIIDRQDHFAHKCKNWALLLWGGSIVYIYGQADMDKTTLLYITLAIPILFWLVDATWRSTQRHSIYRTMEISNFLNSPEFRDAFKSGYNHEESSIWKNFKLWDPSSDNASDKAGLKEATNIWNVLRFKTIIRFYLPIILLTVILILESSGVF